MAQVHQVDRTLGGGCVVVMNGGDRVVGMGREEHFFNDKWK